MTILKSCEVITLGTLAAWVNYSSTRVAAVLDAQLNCDDPAAKV